MRKKGQSIKLEKIIINTTIKFLFSICLFINQERTLNVILMVSLAMVIRPPATARALVKSNWNLNNELSVKLLQLTGVVCKGDLI